jgi:WD40 repeat protein/tRNA A-37 threonylcarbamoyl transferase component Bud32
MADEQRIRELVEEILNSQCAPEEACASCPELLPQVRRRLARIRRVEQQIEAIFPSTDSVSGKPATPSRSSEARFPAIDGYEIQGLLGHGGMGVVYQARHLKLNRIVALKMLLAGQYASPQAVARFVRESQAVAELQHPHIVQVHDVGEFDGRPFFTMEFVEGGSLARELAGAPQPARRAAELVATLAGAVHVAHSKGIIHRDLKPANILLSGDRTPKIADFGLARHVDGDPKLTLSDARVGTPSYMAPEQALGKLGVIGPSVDIYALGAILYEMLTGRPPFRAETAIETERQVITVEAAPPSRLNANVPRDLENICLMCLHKDPARRYSSAAELENDLRRFLEGRPVHARPTGVLERAWRWGARNRGVTGALLGVALLLTLIVVGSLWAAAHFRKLEGEHLQLAHEKGNLADQKELLLAEKERERVKAVVAEERETGLRRNSETLGHELRRNLYLTEMNLAGQAASISGGLGRAGELLAPWRENRPDLRNWEWYYLNSLCHRNLSTRMTYAQGVHSLAWSPDGARLASAGADQTVSIWDAFDERPPQRLTGHAREVFSVAWSPDGRRLASASWDRTVRVWDATSGAELFKFEGHTGEVYCAAWSPEGNTIASGGRDHTIHIWDAADGTIRNVLRGHEETVCGVAWSPDGRRLASASHDSTVRIWDVAAETATHTLIGHINWVNQVAWSPDGSRLASASNDETLRIWNAENGQELRTLRGHTQGVEAVAWSPDGARLASSSDDQTVKVWLAATGAEAFSLRGHTVPLTTVAWNPQGDRIASAGYEGAIKIWDASAGAETPTLAGHENPVHALAWSPRDSRLCASADASGFVKVWDTATRTVLWTLQGDQHHLNSVAWHPAGKLLAAAGGNGLIRIWHLGSEVEPDVLSGHVDKVFSLAFSPDGRRLASGGFDKVIRIWDVASGKVLRAIEDHQGSVFCVAWSPDGRMLSSASSDGSARIWDVATGNEVRRYRGHASQVVTVAWSPNGTILASAGFDQTVHLWDAATARRLSILRGHTTHVAQVLWSPDGTRLASAGRDGTVKVWDPEAGKEALTLQSHASQVSAVAWSPDGMILASGGIDHQIRIHDATAGYVAARAPQLLPIIDRRLAVDSSRSADWRLRAQIFAKRHDWDQAAVDIRQYLLLKPNPAWLIPECLVAGPYPADLTVGYPPEDEDLFAISLLKKGTVPVGNADLLRKIHSSERDSPLFQQTAMPRPAGGDDESRPRINWKTVPGSEQGIVDFGSFTDRSDNVSAYALFPIFSVDEQQVAILLGSDDRARLWLNGQQIYESLRSGAAIPDEDAIPAMLKSGWNTLLVRVDNQSGDHALYLRLSDSGVDMARARERTKRTNP